MRYEIVNVTPDMANEWLKKNEGNRPLRLHRAAFLARAIESGHWKLTHQAVAFTKRGRLLDGQHRLRAVILANRAVKMAVAYDVPEDAFAVMDAGLPRSMAERLHADKKETEIMRSLFRLMANRPTPHEYEVETMLDCFDASLKALAAVKRPGRGFQKFARAPYMGAVTLRIAANQQRKDGDAVLRIQWLLGKLFTGDLVGTPPIIQSFFRQVLEGVANMDIGVAPNTDQFARAWRAFNPELEGVQRLQVTDHSGELRDARLTFNSVTQGVFV